MAIHKQVTVKVEAYVTIAFDIPDTDPNGFSIEEEVDTFIQEMDYNFEGNPDYPGVVVETMISGHEIKVTTDI